MCCKFFLISFQQIEDEHQHFKVADKNRDGFLDSEEYAMFTYPWNYSHMYKLDVEKNMKRFDADKDGHLDFEVSARFFVFNWNIVQITVATLIQV